MPTRVVTTLKVVVHILCLLPFFWLLHLCQNGTVAQHADPVKFITHFTGHWAIWILVIDLAITPVRRLHPSLAFLIRFRRLVGLYAFFYASLHLAIYLFLFSGYDFPAAFAGLKAGHPFAPWTQFRLVSPALWQDVQKRAFIKAGFAAWGLLLLLAMTSPVAVMRKMGRNWRRLHTLVYLAAYLGLVHFWWQMKPGMPTPGKITIVFFALLLARVVYWAVKKIKARRNLQAQNSF